jgi:hypothetical protein
MLTTQMDFSDMRQKMRWEKVHALLRDEKVQMHQTQHFPSSSLLLPTRKQVKALPWQQMGH